VVAQFEFQHFPTSYPFKFNSSWLREVEFVNLVKEVWLDQGFLLESDIQLRFVWKLKELKNKKNHGPSSEK
jgi:hypothetical protein